MDNKKPVEQWSVAEIISFLISESEHVRLVPKNRSLFFLLERSPDSLMNEVKSILDARNIVISPPKSAE